MRELFLSWLKNATEKQLCLQRGKQSYFFMRFSQNNRLEYIFCQHNYYNKSIQIDDFKYVAIYDTMENVLHDVQYELSSIIPDLPKGNFEDTKKIFSTMVNNKINSIIGNDINNSIIQSDDEIKDQSRVCDIKYAREYKEIETVRELFLSGKNPADVVFNAHYSIRNWTRNDYIRYIMDAQATIDQYADDWIKRNAEQIYAIFVCNEIIKEELQKLINDIGNELHTLKTIIHTMTTTDCKTVNVTTIIDGKELTFKINADDLRRDCGNHYPGWNIMAADRREFEKLYGKNVNFKPHDIVKITFGKKVLYKKEKR